MRKLFFLFKIGLFAFIISLLACAVLVFYYTRDLPDYRQLANYHPPSVTRVYSYDGKLIEEYALEHRVFVPISSIPHSLIEAFIAAEDKNFYKHSGVDLISILRAAVANINNKFFLNKGKLEGGSTITQQVVKNFLLTSEKSFVRKIKEAILSCMISQTFTKDQILELYLNQLYLGKGYGVAIAAQNYFNKSIDELTLAESAFLAALPKAPSNYNPRTNYDKSKERRDYVIVRMLEEGYITAAAAKEAIATPITLNSRDPSETITADYYAENVREEVIKMLGKETFYTGGLSIITCLDSVIQKHAEDALVYGIRAYDTSRGYRGPITNISTTNWQENLNNVEVPAGLREYKLAVVLESGDNQSKIGLSDGSTSQIPFSQMKWAGGSSRSILKKGQVIVVAAVKEGYGLRQIPPVNGGIFIMEPNTGKVLAVQGGYDFKASRFDRTTHAQRQPGSLSKTFVYIGALENGIEPDEVFDDAPITIYPAPGLPPWSPKNYKGDFYGPMTMRRGLELSRNLVTVRVAQDIGLNKVAEVIQRFGINKEPAIRYSMVLGALETTLAKMTNAYAIIASGGKKVEPHFIEMIKDRNGKIIYQRNNNKCVGCNVSDDEIDNAPLPQIIEEKKKIILDEATNYQITSMLEGVVQRGTAARAKTLGITIAGKTGTTNDSKDTWFVGFTTNIVVGTYIGYDMPKDLGSRASGSTVALPIFINFIENTYPKNSKIASLPFKIPSSIELYEYGNIIEAYKVNNHDDEDEDDADNKTVNPQRNRNNNDEDNSEEIY